LQEIRSVTHSAQSKVGVEPRLKAAHIENAGPTSTGFDHIRPTVRIEIQARDILDERFTGPKPDL
jgi:hypothetical protein